RFLSNMAHDPELRSHQEWLGYLQPVGLVVSPPALMAAPAFPNKNIIPDHARFLDCVENITLEGESDPRPAIMQFARFATDVRGPPDVAVWRKARHAPRQAAIADHPRRQPEVPEPRLDQAGRTSPGRALSTGPRLPGGRRPAPRRLAPRRAEGRPEPGLWGP